MKEQKNELMLWVGICAIVGLFILFLPSIDKILFGRAKRDKVTEKVVEEENVVKSGRVTCGASISDNETSEYLLFYEDSKVQKVILTVNTIFAQKNDDFNKAKQDCDAVVTKYANQTGFKATCTSSDLTITNKQEFDLKTYKDFTIMNDDNSTTSVSLDIKLNDDIEKTIKKLKEIGATCK